MDQDEKVSAATKKLMENLEKELKILRDTLKALETENVKLKNNVLTLTQRVKVYKNDEPPK